MRNPPSLLSERTMLELNRSEHPIRQAVLVAPIEHRAGRVAVPTGPGLGIDRAALDRFRA